MIGSPPMSLPSAKLSGYASRHSQPVVVACCLSVPELARLRPPRMVFKTPAVCLSTELDRQWADELAQCHTAFLCNPQRMQGRHRPACAIDGCSECTCNQSLGLHVQAAVSAWWSDAPAACRQSAHSIKYASMLTPAVSISLPQPTVLEPGPRVQEVRPMLRTRTRLLLAH
jgi:hypothetical protein